MTVFTSATVGVAGTEVVLGALFIGLADGADTSLVCSAINAPISLTTSIMSFPASSLKRMALLETLT